MMHAGRKAQHLYDTIGARGLLTKGLRVAAARIASRIYAKHTELVILRDLGEPVDLVQRPGLWIREIGPDDAGLVTRFNERYRVRDSVAASKSYLKNGYKGFLVFFEGELAGYWWWVDVESEAAVTHPCIERLEIDLKEGDLYGFDYFVAPPYRQHGLAVRCLSLMYRALRAKGYRRVWAFVDERNLPARWVYQAVGNRRVRQVVSRELLSMLLFQDGRVFIRNSTRNLAHAFDRRLLISWRSSKAPDLAS